jgi:hypothetical protein
MAENVLFWVLFQTSKCVKFLDLFWYSAFIREINNQRANIQRSSLTYLYNKAYFPSSHKK